MIRHQAIGRTEQSFPCGGVEHHFPKAGVKRFVEPALAALGDGHGPMDYGIALIMLAGQTWKVKGAAGSLAGKAMVYAVIRRGCHAGEE